jgi:glutathione-independent formaldehyde dehydrogenase
MGGWIGGQAEYVMIPYADFNLLKFPDKAQAMEKMQDLTCITDILPTGYHGCVTAGVTTGSTVLVSGAGPVGLAAAASAFLLGAAVVIVSDYNKARLTQAASFGCETIDLSRGGTIGEWLEKILKVPEVDCAVDCVGFEAKQSGGEEQPATVLNQLMIATRAAGKIGIPGLYVTEDPGAQDTAARTGNLSLRFGLGWARSHTFSTGQTPVMKYHRGLMMAILNERIRIAKAVNTTIISLDAAPKGYADFDKGVAKKFVIDPHGSLT